MLNFLLLINLNVLQNLRLQKSFRFYILNSNSCWIYTTPAFSRFHANKIESSNALLDRFRTAPFRTAWQGFQTFAYISSFAKNILLNISLQYRLYYIYIALEQLISNTKTLNLYNS